MKRDDAEDLWLACVLQAPTYADHSLISMDHLTPRAQVILEEVKEIASQGWPMVSPDQIVKGNLRTIERRMETVDAATTIEAAERTLLEAWANDRYHSALRSAATICEADGREAAESHLADAVQKLQGSTAGLHWKSPAEVALEVLEKIRRLLTEDAPEGLGSGMVHVDRACKNFPPKRMTTIGGWTNEGKSTLMLQLCTGMAMRGRHTAIISLEDEEEIMVRRQIVMLADELAAVRRFVDDESIAADLELFHDIIQGKDGLRNLPMDLIYMPGASTERICYAIQDAARKGARVIAVDYLQCIDGQEGEKRAEVLGRAARKMKAAAAQVGAHLMLVSQLRRPKDAAARTTPPSMYMFKETGDVENQTEYALLVWRPKKGEKVPVERAQVIVDKAKDGNCGVIDVGWDTTRHQFTNEAPDEAATGQMETQGGNYSQR